MDKTGEIFSLTEGLIRGCVVPASFLTPCPFNKVLFFSIMINYLTLCVPQPAVIDLNTDKRMCSTMQATTPNSYRFKICNWKHFAFSQTHSILMHSSHKKTRLYLKNQESL